MNTDVVARKNVVAYIPVSGQNYQGNVVMTDTKLSDERLGELIAVMDDIGNCGGPVWHARGTHIAAALRELQAARALIAEALPYFKHVAEACAECDGKGRTRGPSECPFCARPRYLFSRLADRKP
jgi:hypothetical protein